MTKYDKQLSNGCCLIAHEQSAEPRGYDIERFLPAVPHSCIPVDIEYEKHILSFLTYQHSNRVRSPVAYKLRLNMWTRMPFALFVRVELELEVLVPQHSFIDEQLRASDSQSITSSKRRRTAAPYRYTGLQTKITTRLQLRNITNRNWVPILRSSPGLLRGLV
jgi:hypothetical protein